MRKSPMEESIGLFLLHEVLKSIYILFYNKSGNKGDK